MPSYLGSSLVVSWFRCGVFTAAGLGLIPGLGTEIPHQARAAVKKKKGKKNPILKVIGQRKSWEGAGLNVA